MVHVRQAKEDSVANVRRALPGLSTNQLLNSKLFQGELDQANANRDLQIYPRIQPGPEPGTTALVLDVKDRLPLHGRFELNNQSTPGTPNLRGNGSVQYNNLWDREHSVGLQYTFAMEQMKQQNDMPTRWFDEPLIANYSAYYRMPLGEPVSLPALVESNPGRFGYDEATRQFRLPPSSGRSELNFFASRSTTDTGIKLGARKQVAKPPFAIFSQDSGEDLTTTEGFGARWSKPLQEWNGVRSILERLQPSMN